MFEIFHNKRVCKVLSRMRTVPVVGVRTMRPKQSEVIELKAGGQGSKRA